MMLQEITSRDVEITFPLSPDVFVSSWSGEIRVDRPEEWFLSFWKNPLKHLSCLVLFSKR